MLMKTEQLKVIVPDLSGLKLESVLIFGLAFDEAAKSVIDELKREIGGERTWALADKHVAKTLSKDYCLNLSPYRDTYIEDLDIVPEVKKVDNHFSVLRPEANILRFVDLVGFTAPGKTMFIRVHNWRVQLMIYSQQ